jgi:stress response protein YsnF
LLGSGKVFSLLSTGGRQLPNEKIDHQEDVTLKLHKEELQIVKKWVETADVTVYKDANFGLCNP